MTSFLFQISEPAQPPMMLQGHSQEVTSVAWCPTDFTKVTSCDSIFSFFSLCLVVCLLFVCLLKAWNADKSPHTPGIGIGASLLNCWSRVHIIMMRAITSFCFYTLKQYKKNSLELVFFFFKYIYILWSKGEGSWVNACMCASEQALVNLQSSLVRLFPVQMTTPFGSGGWTAGKMEHVPQLAKRTLWVGHVPKRNPRVPLSLVSPENWKCALCLVVESLTFVIHFKLLLHLDTKICTKSLVWCYPFGFFLTTRLCE